MKKVILILGFLVISFSGFAQEGNDVKQSDLQGPAFKNYKFWKHNTVPTEAYSENNKTALSGPAYKNRKTWKATSQENLVVVNTVTNEKQNLIGPAYKNHGPWSKKNK